VSVLPKPGELHVRRRPRRIRPAPDLRAPQGLRSGPGGDFRTLERHLTWSCVSPTPVI